MSLKSFRRECVHRGYSPRLYCFFLYYLEIDVPESLSFPPPSLSDPTFAPLKLVPLSVEVLRGRCVLLALPGKTSGCARQDSAPSSSPRRPRSRTRCSSASSSCSHWCRAQCRNQTGDPERRRYARSAPTSAQLKLGMRHHSVLADGFYDCLSKMHTALTGASSWLLRLPPHELFSFLRVVFRAPFSLLSKAFWIASPMVGAAGSCMTHSMSSSSSSTSVSAWNLCLTTPCARLGCSMCLPRVLDAMCAGCNL